jgi:type III secretion protein R
MIAFLAAAHPLLAQIPAAVEDQPISKPIVIMMVLVVLSLAPFLVMMMTSFIKISVVLSLLRTALGTQQIPPNQIITGLSLILTIYIMLPVGQDVYDRVQGVIHESGGDQPLLSIASVDKVKKAIEVGREPVREFLKKNANTKERSLFFNLAKQLRGNRQGIEVGEEDFLVLVPSFIITELSEAFQIGFVIFLPFLVIDMVVSNILLALGMFMVSPVTIALPFKLLLFVLVDGWFLITKGLVLGYIK